MLRLLGFFLGVVILSRLLGVLPIVGPLIAHTGIFGILLTAMLLSALVSYFGKRAMVVQRDRAQVRALGAVDSPYNHGKLGSIYLAQGRPGRALEHLRRAAEGEPETAEWHYRMGCAQLALGAAPEAVAALRRAVELDEEHAYGAALMRLGEAETRAGLAEEALATLARQERAHGPTPEAAYRRGLALKLQGERGAARQAFEEVPVLAAEVARYQKQAAMGWALRARLARLF